MLNHKIKNTTQNEVAMNLKKFGMFNTLPTVPPRWNDLQTKHSLQNHRRFQDDKNQNRILDIRRHKNGEISIEFSIPVWEEKGPYICTPTNNHEKLFAFIDRINAITNNSLNPIEHILKAFIDNDHDKHLKCSDIKVADVEYKYSCKL